MKKNKLLFISRWFPYPPNNGAKLRIFYLLSELSKVFEINLICFYEDEDLDRRPIELMNICKEVYTVQLKKFKPKSIKAILGFFSLKPRSIYETYSSEMVNQIKEAINIHNPQLVIASQLGSAIYHDHYAHLPSILEELEIALIYENYWKAASIPARLRNGLTWWKHRRLVKSVMQAHKLVTVVSQEEKELISKNIPGNYRVQVVPNCVEVSRYQDITKVPQNRTLIFTGSFDYQPNYEAMLWFIQEVFPLVKIHYQETQLTITGRHSDRPLPSYKDIGLTGFVNDIRPLIAQSWISIVPIFSGGGTRLKILEAMALRTPVISTRKGAEGLNYKDGENILIADTPNEFSSQIKRLFDEPELRNRITSNAFQLVLKKYNWQVAYPQLIISIQSLIPGKPK